MKQKSFDEIESKNMSLKGLTSLEVEERIRQGKINKNLAETDRPVWEIVKRNTFTFFNLIFAVIAVLISLVQAWNQLIFLANNCHQYNCRNLSRNQSQRDILTK